MANGHNGPTSNALLLADWDNETVKELVPTHPLQEAECTAQGITLKRKTVIMDRAQASFTGQSDIHCKIKETLLIRDLKPALNEMLALRKFFSTSHLYFCLQISLVCLFSFTFSLSLLSLSGISLKFNCSLGNR